MSKLFESQSGPLRTPAFPVFPPYISPSVELDYMNMALIYRSAIFQKKKKKNPRSFLVCNLVVVLKKVDSLQLVHFQVISDE